MLNLWNMINTAIIYMVENNKPKGFSEKKRRGVEKD